MINTNIPKVTKENYYDYEFENPKLIEKENITEEFFNKHRYYIIHKPIKTVSTKSDPLNHKTVYEVAKEKNFPIDNVGLVGRLDKLTSGIMLFTSDSGLNRALSLPMVEKEEKEEKEAKDEKKEEENDNDNENEKDDEEYENDNEYEKEKKDSYDKYNKNNNSNINHSNKISNLFKEKEYILSVSSRMLFNENENRQLNEEELDKIKQEFSEPFTFIRQKIIRKAGRSKIEILRYYRNPDIAHNKPNLGWTLDVLVKIKEGKHHQIRRIAERSKMKVIFLKRIKIGNILTIDTIPKEGDCRWLSYDEVKTLYEGLGIYQKNF
jgi:16S rRNA U516 pseudouridylate synthase RsuA-like enzyme